MNFKKLDKRYLKSGPMADLRNALKGLKAQQNCKDIALID